MPRSYIVLCIFIYSLYTSGKFSCKTLFANNLHKPSLLNLWKAASQGAFSLICLNMFESISVLFLYFFQFFPPLFLWTIFSPKQRNAPLAFKFNWIPFFKGRCIPIFRNFLHSYHCFKDVFDYFNQLLSEFLLLFSHSLAFFLLLLF